MPLAQALPETPSEVIPNTPKITEQSFSGVVVDTKYVPLSSLLTYIEGASWTVTYYSQVLDKDNDIRSQDVEISGVYQQYHEINGMELKVTNPLTSSQDSATNRMTVNGSGNVYPFIIPNVGDMFAADVGDGREGIFKITSSEKKSLLKESIYAIEYTLLYYSDQDQVRRKDLVDKSINSYFYVKDFLLHGQNPLLISEDYHAYEELDNLYFEITKNYFNWFFSNEYKTLIVPGQSFIVYDHFLTEAIIAILNTRDAPQLMNIRKLNVDDDDYLKQPQIWKAIANRDLSLLDLSNKKMGLVSVKSFTKDPMLNGIRFSGVNFVVYPSRPELLLNSGMQKQSKTLALEKITKVTSRSVSLSKLMPDKEYNILANFTVNIKPVLIDDTYVFSDSFYSNGSDPTGKDKSLLEILTLDFLSDKAINPVVLMSLIKNYKNWGQLERFYYLPICLALIKSVVRRI